MENAWIIGVTLAVAAILIYPRVANARLWRATVTPLASIIGSGFLVLGPILSASFGYMAPLVMAILCLGAYLFGSAIRYNIAVIESARSDRPRHEQWLETAASWSLAFAYFISVAYYLNLFGAFAVSLTPFGTPLAARIVTSSMLVLILVVGWFWGFKALERMEQVSVGVKLAIIAGLLVGVGWFFFGLAGSGKLEVVPPVLSGWAAVTLVFGLLVTVQGFETSRYLGANYNALTRIRSMRLAQVVSTLIYMIYIGFLTFSFHVLPQHLTETAIISLMVKVAPVLPAMLVAAALAAQFSAAIADTNGSGGLISELTARRIKPRQAYAILSLVGLGLTWSTNLFEIISYASRAFAVYYGLQSAIAFATALRRPGDRIWAPVYLALALLGMMVAVFGTAVE